VLDHAPRGVEDLDAVLEAHAGSCGVEAEPRRLHDLGRVRVQLRAVRGLDDEVMDALEDQRTVVGPAKDVLGRGSGARSTSDSRAIPVSSTISRIAAASGVSPGSTWPFGKPQ
jgi:hypothetical protein